MLPTPSIITQLLANHIFCLVNYTQNTFCSGFHSQFFINIQLYFLYFYNLNFIFIIFIDRSYLFRWYVGTICFAVCIIKSIHTFQIHELHPLNFEMFFDNNECQYMKQCFTWKLYLDIELWHCLPNYYSNNYRSLLNPIS